MTICDRSHDFAGEAQRLGQSHPTEIGDANALPLYGELVIPRRKTAVLEALREAGISKSELGRRINKDEKEVRRILDPKHPTKLPALTATLRALGRRLVIGIEKADVTASI